MVIYKRATTWLERCVPNWFSFLIKFSYLFLKKKKKNNNNNNKIIIIYFPQYRIFEYFIWKCLKFNLLIAVTFLILEILGNSSKKQSVTQQQANSSSNLFQFTSARISKHTPIKLLAEETTDHYKTFFFFGKKSL